MLTGPRIRTPIAAAALIAMLATPASARPVGRVVPTRDTRIVKALYTTWTPSTIGISRNDTIKWKVVTGSHTVTAYGGNWQFNHSLNLGSPVARRFNHTATFKFRCTFHSSLAGNSCTGMCGKVVVSA